MTQYVYFFGGGKADGHKDMKDTLGGMHGTAHGRARVAEGHLSVDGRTGYVSTKPIAREWCMAKSTWKRTTINRPSGSRG